MIEYQSQFLLICRGSLEEQYKNLWAFPGGKVEPGETAIDTIYREVREETGLELTDEGAFLNSYCFPGRVGLTFLVRAISNQVKLGSELTDFRWVSSLDDLKALRCIPGIHNHLVRAQDRLRHGDFDRLSEMNLRKEVYLNR